MKVDFRYIFTSVAAPFLLFLFGAYRDIYTQVAVELNLPPNSPGWLLWVAIALSGITMSVVGYLNRPARLNRKLLEKLLAYMLPLLGFPEDSDARAMIWVPSGNPWLVPATKYAPKGKPSTQKRIRNNQGITGKAFTRKQSFSYMLDPEITEQEYEDELVDAWGFTEDEAARINKSRRGFLAVPILSSDSEGRIKGIIYVDCKDSRTLLELDENRVLDRAENAVKLIEHLI